MAHPRRKICLLVAMSIAAVTASQEDLGPAPHRSLHARTPPQLQHRRHGGRCVGTAGAWCGSYYMQPVTTRKPPPILGKTCPKGCSGIGVCHGDTGTCDCPAGWGGPSCSDPLKRPCTRAYRTPRNSSMPNSHIGPDKRDLDWSKKGSTYSRCAGICDDDIAACYCDPKLGNPKHGRVPAPPGSPPGTPPIQEGRQLFDPCSRPADGAEGRRLGWVEGGVAYERVYGPQGWCVADEPQIPECRCDLDGWGGPGCRLPSEMFCLNQCSGRGRCLLGFCHCDPGWWGLDCARAASEAAAKLPRPPVAPWLAELAVDAWACSSGRGGCLEDMCEAIDAELSSPVSLGRASPGDAAAAAGGAGHGGGDDELWSLDAWAFSSSSRGGDDSSSNSSSSSSTLPALRLPPPPPQPNSPAAAAAESGAGAAGDDIFSSIADEWAVGPAGSSSSSSSSSSPATAAEQASVKSSPQQPDAPTLDATFDPTDGPAGPAAAERRRQRRHRRLQQRLSRGLRSLVGDNGGGVDKRGREDGKEARVRPLIYVYDVPSIYAGRMLQYRLYKDMCTWRVFDTEYGNSTLTSPYPYASEPLLLELLLGSHHRTLNPEEADFFYVPVMSTCWFHPVSGWADYPWWYVDSWSRVSHAVMMTQELLDWVRHTHPYWNRTNGADHIWFFAHDEGACWAPSEVYENSIILTHWGRMGANHTSGTSYGQDNYSADVLDDPFNPLGFKRLIGRHPCYTPGKDLVVPLFRGPDRYHASPYLGAPQPKRDILLFHRGRMGEKDPPNYSRGVRQKIAALARRHDWARRYKIHVGGYDDLPGDYSSLLARSVFCLVAAGDGWSARFDDAMLHGCIPVIIIDGVVGPWGHQLRWRAFSVRIPEDSLEKLPDVLLGIPQADIKRMQRAAAAVWRRFAWLSHPALLRAARGIVAANGEAAAAAADRSNSRSNVTEGGVGSGEAARRHDRLGRGVWRDDAFGTIMQWLHHKLETRSKGGGGGGSGGGLFSAQRVQTGGGSSDGRSGALVEEAAAAMEASIHEAGLDEIGSSSGRRRRRRRHHRLQGRRHGAVVNAAGDGESDESGGPAAAV